MKQLLIILLILLLIGVGILIVVKTNSTTEVELTPQDESTTRATTESPREIDTITYQCDEGKSLTATYYDGSAPPSISPGEPPQPTGSVDVVVDGGATMNLQQTISADGIRYANENESFVFWSKGDTALIMRDNEMDRAYTNCVAEE